MGRKPDGGEEPTLELPKLFGRRTKKQAPAAPEGQQPATPTAPPPPAEPAAEPQAEPETLRVPPPPDPQPEPAPRPTPQPRPAAAPHPASRRRRAAPVMPATPAALLTGLLVGAVGSAVTFLALLGCEAVRGTDSCGGPGLFLLIAIVALMILLGAGLLTLLGLPSAGSTSFLAVGLVVVLVMLALLDVVDSPWMFLVVPLLSAASYALFQWVTTRFADEAADPPVFDDGDGRHDVR